MSDTAQESDFRWLNGDPLRYEKFKSGEPREANAQNCIRMTTNGRWQDGICHVHPQYICLIDRLVLFLAQIKTKVVLVLNFCKILVSTRFCGVCAR